MSQAVGGRSSASGVHPIMERDLYQRLGVDPSADGRTIRSAYLLLAHRLHPDRNAWATAHRSMAQLNEAYTVLRDPVRREAYDHSQAQPTPIVTARPSHRDAAGRVILDFGRYRGWALEEIAKRDVGYLEWLRRHSSGPRYRQEIERVLSKKARARR